MILIWVFKEPSSFLGLVIINLVHTHKIQERFNFKIYNYFNKTCIHVFNFLILNLI